MGLLRIGVVFGRRGYGGRQMEWGCCCWADGTWNVPATVGRTTDGMGLLLLGGRQMEWGWYCWADDGWNGAAAVGRTTDGMGLVLLGGRRMEWGCCCWADGTWNVPATIGRTADGIGLLQLGGAGSGPPTLRSPGATSSPKSTSVTVAGPAASESRSVMAFELRGCPLQRALIGSH
jgi:hypothetical protein